MLLSQLPPESYFIILDSENPSSIYYHGATGRIFQLRGSFKNFTLTEQPKNNHLSDNTEVKIIAIKKW